MNLLEIKTELKKIAKEKKKLSKRAVELTKQLYKLAEKGMPKIKPEMELLKPIKKIKLIRKSKRPKNITMAKYARDVSRKFYVLESFKTMTKPKLKKYINCEELKENLMPDLLKTVRGYLNVEDELCELKNEMTENDMRELNLDRIGELVKFKKENIKRGDIMRFEYNDGYNLDHWNIDDDNYYLVKHTQNNIATLIKMTLNPETIQANGNEVISYEYYKKLSDYENYGEFETVYMKYQITLYEDDEEYESDEYNKCHIIKKKNVDNILIKKYIKLD